MVCSTAILSASLALSLLRHGLPPEMPAVISPYSLATALSIVHDGSNGTTQQELANLLLNGCTPAEVTEYYSSLARSLPTANDAGAAFKSANRLYVDHSISLKSDYQKHVEEKYGVKVENVNLNKKVDAAQVMNQFVNGATDGMMENVVNADGISDDAKLILINAIHFIGKWKYPFNPASTRVGDFREANGAKNNVEYMNLEGKSFRSSQNSNGTVLILPYKDEEYSFFFFMPNKTTHRRFEKFRSDLTGEKLLSVLKEARASTVDISVPKLGMKSKVDGVMLLKLMGVNSLFGNTADLSKISDAKLLVSKIVHDAVIKVYEAGTEAGASTQVEISLEMARPRIVVDRAFLFGILKGEHIVFLGQKG